ncbi:MAG: VOC family protein [bacterium]
MPSTTTATLGRFVWHELMTTNPSAAQAFYKEVVGWTTSKWDQSPVDYTMWMSGEVPIGGVMAMIPDADAMDAPPSWTAYIETPDVDHTVEQAVKLGATVLIEPHTVEDIGRFGVLRDPQGAMFAVITNATPLPEESDPQPLEFSWHELMADDPEAAIEFYQEVFGWENKGESDMGDQGVYRMFGRDRFTYGGVMKTPDGMSIPPHWVHYVRVPDSADAAVSRAEASGGTVIVAPIDVPGGDRIAVLTDPQGATFAVHSKAT